MTEHQPEAPAVPGVTRWRHKAVEVEAMQLTHESGPRVWEWADSKPTYGTDKFVDGLAIYTKAGRVRASWNDWIVRHGPGDFTKCTAEEFAATYEPAPEPLILPPDEFRAVQVVAAVLGLPGSAPEPDGPATEATQTPEAIRELEARFREAVAKRGPLTVLPSDRWQERAEAAEAKLAEVEALCRDARASAPESVRTPSVAVVRILGILGSEEGADRA